METQRLKKQSMFNFLAALLGSIFGLMGTFSFIMSSIEDFISIYSKKISNNKYIKEYEDRMKNINSQFKPKTRENKITPVNLTVPSL